MIKIASCEDNAAIRASLASFFDKMKKEENLKIQVDFFENGEQLLSSKTIEYDIYLLDIHMGDHNLNGMSLAQNIRQYDDHAIIIFLTSLTRYLKEGYKVKAYRYLTKPISYTEFKHELGSAISEAKKSENDFINIIEYSKFNKVKLTDIYFIETYQRKTLIHTKKGDIVSSYSMSTLTEMLKEKNFFRCHNSYLINIDYVEYLDNKTVRVHGTDLLVSRNKSKELKERVAQAVGTYF